MSQYLLSILFTFILFFSTINLSIAQNNLTQQITGLVGDANSKIGINGASVIIQNDSISKGTATLENGSFSIKGIPTGRYQIRVSHVGYSTKILNDFLIEGGKTKHIDIFLSPAPRTLDEVTIQEVDYAHAEYSAPSAYDFSVEESQRFAATFYDPGRMALSFPGVTSANDQSNNISIRGNAPYTNAWRLEGADIVNPNHLTNAGTLTDRISVVGGGVNILSAQLMDNSTLLTGAFPAEYGDALGGFMDINLREGNKTSSEYTIQAGLLGLDLAAEGPVGKNQNASYLVNYRYSTIGLLEAIGIPVSDESINFQDLSFNTSFATGDHSSWNVFGIFGTSKESFEAECDTTVWEETEDRINTDFTSNMGALGVSNKLILSENTSLKNVVIASQIDTDRKAYFVNDEYESSLFQNDEYSEGMVSLNSRLYHKTKSNHALSGGITLNHTFFKVLSEESQAYSISTYSTLVSQENNYQMIRAFIDYEPFLTERTKVILGLHSLYFNLNKEVSIEPRLGISYLSGPHSKLDFRYGLVSQSHFPQVYFVTRESDQAAWSFPNRDLKLSKSHQFTLAYTLDINPLTTLKIESYFQKHYNIPISAKPESTFSLINSVDAYLNEELVNEGKGLNKGVELLIDRDFKNGFYFLFSSALYDANYVAADGKTRSTRYDGDYSFSFTGGKEIYTSSVKKNNLFGINIRMFWQGGYRYTPIDLNASRIENQTVYIEEEAFTQKMKDNIRADLRLYFKKNKKKYTRTFSIDIQNVTARENEAYQYYDEFSDEIITKKQLGILPFISYRIEF